MKYKKLFGTILFFLTISYNSYSNTLDDKFIIRNSKVYRLRTKEKFILLTIDDGPSSYTPDILLTLEKHKVPAIFFLVGSEIKEYPNYAKMISDNFTIGMHSMSHKNFYEYPNFETIVQKEILPFEMLSLNFSLNTTKLMRPPYGNLYVKHARKLTDKGFIPFYWDVDSVDWKNSSSKAANTTINTVHSGAIILMHSNKKSQAYLESIIPRLRRKGYVFLSYDEVLNNNLDHEFYKKKFAAAPKHKEVSRPPVVYDEQKQTTKYKPIKKVDNPFKSHF